MISNQETLNLSNEVTNELANREKVIENEPQIAQVPTVKERLITLKEFVEDTQHHLQYSVDTEARVGHKSADSSFFGYKTHIAMSDERIITAATVTTTRIRYKIEEKNSELKNPHGYDMAKSSGLFGMGIQAATTIFTVNLKRIIKLMNEKE